MIDDSWTLNEYWKKALGHYLLGTVLGSIILGSNSVPRTLVALTIIHAIEFLYIFGFSAKPQQSEEKEEKEEVTTKDPRRCLTSDAVEHAMSSFAQFEEEGSEHLLLHNRLMAVDLDVLEERFKCADIFPIVEVKLVRTKDRNNKTRVKMANRIAENISVSMSEYFTGSCETDSELILAIRISMVSDGDPAGVSIFYSLFSRTTGKVAIAKHVTIKSTPKHNTDNAGNVLNDLAQELRTSSIRLSTSIHKSTEVVDKLLRQQGILDLAEELRAKVNQEVMFSACTKLDEWKDSAEELLTPNAQRF